MPEDPQDSQMTVPKCSVQTRSDDKKDDHGRRKRGKLLGGGGIGKGLKGE